MTEPHAEQPSKRVHSPVPLAGVPDHPSLEAECRRLRVENSQVHQLLLNAEATIGMRDRELSLCYARLFLYESRADSNLDSEHDSREPESPVSPNSAAPPHPYILPPPVRPTATHEELLKSSIWAESGRPDPSVELHPLSSWYHWFRSTFPILDYAPIRAPPEPSEASLPGRVIPYSLPPYVFRLMGPEADHWDQKEAEKAQEQVMAGEKIKPPPPREDLYGDLGAWRGAQIKTILQAHNLRHAAITDKDTFAARAYRSLHTTFSDRTEKRSEGVQYLMKAFSADSHLLKRSNQPAVAITTVIIEA